MYMERISSFSVVQVTSTKTGDIVLLEEVSAVRTIPHTRCFYSTYFTLPPRKPFNWFIKKEAFKMETLLSLMISLFGW